MLIFILTAIVAVYLLGLLNRSKRRLSTASTKVVRIFLLASAPISATLLILRQFNIHPNGYWTLKGLFWTVILLMMILFGFGNKSMMTRCERIIYGFFYFLPLGFALFLLIPFMGIGVGLLFYVSFIGDKSLIAYSDKNIRIQQQYIRFLGPDPPLEIYVKDHLFSYRDTVLPIHYNDQVDSLSVSRLNDSTYSLMYYSPNNWEVPNGFVEFKFSIKSDRYKSKPRTTTNFAKAGHQ